MAEKVGEKPTGSQPTGIQVLVGEPGAERTAKAVVMRNDRRSENTLYQGVVLLADGNTVSLPAVEKFRILRAKIERMNLSERKYTVIAVTSAVPQEGKSVTSVNLARALSIDPQGKTLIIDADLRRPTVHSFFDLTREPGLSDVLTGRCLLHTVIRNAASGLDVITAGNACSDPTQLVEQPEFPALIQELRQCYRYIIVDCPPVLLCPEPITISAIVDSTIMVVRAWRTARRLVQDATAVIGRSKLLGVVLNDGVDASKQYLDYGYYGDRPPKSA